MITIYMIELKRPFHARQAIPFCESAQGALVRKVTKAKKLRFDSFEWLITMNLIQQRVERPGFLAFIRAFKTVVS